MIEGLKHNYELVEIVRQYKALVVVDTSQPLL